MRSKIGKSVGGYDSIEGFGSDVKLLVANCERFNGVASPFQRPTTGRDLRFSLVFESG